MAAFKFQPTVCHKSRVRIEYPLLPLPCFIGSRALGRQIPQTLLSTHAHDFTFCCSIFLLHLLRELHYFVQSLEWRRQTHARSIAGSPFVRPSYSSNLSFTLRLVYNHFDFFDSPPDEITFFHNSRLLSRRSLLARCERFPRESRHFSAH